MEEVLSGWVGEGHKGKNLTKSVKERNDAWIKQSKKKSDEKKLTDKSVICAGINQFKKARGLLQFAPTLKCVCDPFRLINSSRSRRKTV